MCAVHGHVSQRMSMLLVNRRMDMCGAHGHVPEYMSMSTTHVHVRWTWKCALVMSMCAGHRRVSQRMSMSTHGHVSHCMSMLQIASPGRCSRCGKLDDLLVGLCVMTNNAFASPARPHLEI